MAMKFQPLDRDALGVRYGSFYDAEPKVVLNHNRVPLTLRTLIPYVEIWGVSDDLEREHLVMRAPEVARKDLEELVDTYNDELDKWLAGPEANEEEYSHEYIVFSAMRMARDFL